jgi:hypothetical protein
VFTVAEPSLSVNNSTIAYTVAPAASTDTVY